MKSSWTLDNLPPIDNWIKSYLRYTDNSEPPTLFREWCAVSVIAAALQRKCWLEWGTVMMYPNLYVVLTAPAGKARKGTAMQPAKKLLSTLGIPMSAEAITREALIKLLRESERDIDGIGGAHSSLTVMSPELTVFLGYNNVQMLADLTDWFDCADSWTYHTKTAGTDPIRGVYLNLLGATTPDLIRSALPQDAIGGGLTSRIIFVYEEKKGKIVPCPFLSEEEKGLYQQLVMRLEDIYQLKGNFTVSLDFTKAWIDWYTANDGRSPFGLVPQRQLEGYIERRPTQILKLSMIMSAAKRKTMIIEEEDLKDAVSLLERTEVKMPRALGGVGTANDAELTHNILEYLYRQPADLPTLVKNFMYDGGSEGVGISLQTLLKARIIEVYLDDRGKQLYRIRKQPKISGNKEEMK